MDGWLEMVASYRSGIQNRHYLPLRLLGETKEPNLSTFEGEAQNLEHDVSDAALIVTDEEDSS